VVLLPLLELLYSVRNVANLVVELAYYVTQVGFNVASLCVSALLPFPVGVQGFANKIILYMRLFLDGVADIVDLLHGAIFELVIGRGEGKVFVEILRLVCQAGSFIQYWVITRGFCPVVQFLSDFYGWLYDLLTLVANVEIFGFKPLYFLLVRVSNILVLAKTTVDLVITLVCRTPRMACDFGAEEVPNRSQQCALRGTGRCARARQWPHAAAPGDGHSQSQ